MDHFPTRKRASQAAFGSRRDGPGFGTRVEEAALSRALRGILILAAVLLGGSRAAAAEGEGVPTDCKILYQTAEGYYVDVGEDKGLIIGEKAWLRRAGEPVARVEIATVSKNSALLKIISDRSPNLPVTGESVSLVLDRVDLRALSGPQNPNPTLRDQTKGPDQFPALLAEPNLSKVGFTEVKNIFHGRLYFLQAAQVTSNDNNDFFRSRFGTSGTLERIQATPWDLEWSGDIFYRAGDGLERAHDFEELHLQAYRLSLYRRFDDQSFIRLGRFLPIELPSVGFLDGVQAEKVLKPNFRVGGMLGLKPARSNLDFRTFEPTAVGYTTFGLGDVTRPLYTGTLGVLFSFYKGHSDRLALLIEQRAELGRLSLISGTEVDFDAGGTETRSGTRLSREDFIASYHVASILTVRAGASHWERPDTAAERDTVRYGGLTFQEFFDRGYNRYWIGAGHQLPLKLNLNEEVSLGDSSIEDNIVRWEAHLTRTGLPRLPNGSVTVSIYNLKGNEIDGYGARVSGYLPWRRLILMPGAGYRTATFDATSGTKGFDNLSESLDVLDIFLRGQFIFNPVWTLSGGLLFTAYNEESGFNADIGLTFRW